MSFFQTLLQRWRPTLPGTCAVCSAWSNQGLCLDCRHNFVQALHRCACCGVPHPAGTGVCGRCVVSPPAYQTTWVALDYVFPWAHLIGRFKFAGELELCGLWVDFMVGALPSPGCPPRLLVPVPLSAHRLRQRGYNQAWELARRLANILSWPTNPELLVKQRHTLEQASLPMAQRRANVRGAFAVNTRESHRVVGRDVALVDDVMTTGATAHEIAQLLLDSGARSVVVWVLGRTPLPSARSGPMVVNNQTPSFNGSYLWV